MRRVVTPLIVVAVVGATAAVAWRYLWDDPSEASVANYLCSGVHGLAVAVAGWGCHLYFSSRASGWLRRWPLLAEVGVRAVAMAITIAAVIVGLQMVLYGQALEATWLLANFPGIFALAFVLSVAFSAVFELTRLIGGRVLLNVILGRYRHPIREERVLMFLDLADSTAMAEALGEVRMQELLTRFFFDIDEPIVARHGAQSALCSSLARLNQLAGNAARQSVSYLPQMTHPDDPRGWFQWYCRYDMGRRILDEDRRQIRG